MRVHGEAHGEWRVLLSVNWSTESGEVHREWSTGEVHRKRSRQCDHVRGFVRGFAVIPLLLCSLLNLVHNHFSSRYHNIYIGIILISSQPCTSC